MKLFNYFAYYILDNENYINFNKNNIKLMCTYYDDFSILLPN